MDIDHPPGIGMADGMALAVEIVKTQAAIVTSAAMKSSTYCT